MRHVWMAAVAAVACSCGGSAGLPPGTNSGNGSDATGQPVATAQSLWPLSAGSSWTYRITDPAKGVFEKQVRVIGETPVPGLANTTATQVDNSEPTLDEMSWQIASNGLTFRIREEDRKAGLLVRVTTFEPAELKSLSRPQPEGWKYAETSREKELDGAGALKSEKNKSYAWTVEAADVEVTVPAGTFKNALKLRRERTDKQDPVRFYWLVPGVGKVREEGERTEELASFDIKP